MTSIQKFVSEADQLTVQVKENGKKARMICSKLERHGHAARFRAITRFAERASKIFLNRIDEKKNGTKHEDQ